ncbi:MAG: diguanylate cyclase (GGDEF)-like protein/PAS domain S-box-containing protein, partial [Methylophagaceae bacterium]
LRKELHHVTQNRNDLLIHKQQLDAIMDNAPLEMSLKDREGRFIRVNKKFEALFQVKNENLVGMLPPIAHDPKLAATSRKQDLSVLNSGVAEWCEEIVEFGNEDQSRSLLTIKFPVFSVDGKVDGLGAIVTDITEGLATKEKLREHNALFSQAVQFDNAGLWEWDEITDCYITLSEQYANIHGMTTKQMLEIDSIEKALKLVCDDDRERYKQVIGEALEKKQGWSIEYCYYKAGQRIYLHEIGRLVPDDYGVIVKTTGTVQDITKIRQVEEALLRSHALYHQAETMGNMGHFCWDLVKNKLISCSDQFALIFGMTAPEAIDYFISSEAQMNVIHPADKEYFRQGAYDSKGAHTKIDLEYKIITASGDTRHVYTRSELTFGGDGAPLQSFGTIQDITKRKQVELRDKSRTKILELITSGQSLPVILEAIVHVVEQDNPAMLCSVLLLDDAGQHLLSGTAPSLPDFYNEAIHGMEIAVGAGSCGTAAFVNERVIVDDIQTHPYWVTFKALATKAKLGACWSEPIRSTKGEVLGTFAIYHHDIHNPTEADIDSIEQAAGFASIAIEKTRANSILTASENRLRLALTVTKQSWFDLNVQTGAALTSPEYAKLLGYDPDEFQSDLQGWRDNLHPDDYDAVMAAYQNGLSQSNVFSMEYRRRTKGGDWLWLNSTAEVFEWSSSQQPLKMIGIHTDISERKEAEEKLERIAHYDLLTSLPNRALLLDLLNQAMMQCQPLNQFSAIALLDLDGFKAVNDTHDHHVGDELLIIVSQRMTAALCEGDTLARIGGDEFVAVIKNLDKIEDSEPVLERLLRAAAEPVTVGDAVMQVSVSIGVTFYPQDDVDADLLIRHADQAMHVAKQAGKNRYHLFDVAQDNAMKIQRQSIGDIRSAMSRREFVLYYQPKVNMNTGEVVGAEALIRWQHPERGLVPPLAFLPAIEGHAISLELGDWVIDTALNQISHWCSMGLQMPVSVNISAYQLQYDNFTTRLAALLEDHPEVNPHFLELEILETSALNDIKKVSDTMNACLDLGVRFALDDFGTGYSSLTYLKRLPAHLIKIDQSFVRGMLEDADDLSIVEGVVGLAKAFQLEVIAEGVETIDHGLSLLQLGCELAQGYGIARPMPADDLPEWALNWKADDAWQATYLIGTN